MERDNTHCPGLLTIMPKHVAKTLPTVSLLVLSLAAFNAFAVEQEYIFPSESESEDGVVVVYPDKAGQEALQSQHDDLFATHEQRRKVEPMQWNEEVLPSFDTDNGDLYPMIPAIPGNDSGGAANPMANELAKEEFRDDWRLMEAMELEDNGQDMFDGLHGVFSRYAGNFYTQSWQDPPFNKIGKLYFTTPNGNSSYCTANVVTGNSHIVTAAHCIYTRGQGFNGNFVFVPAERFGAAPYGIFGWNAAVVPVNWVNVGGRRWDVGLIRLSNNAINRPVTFYVGWLGLSWNYSYIQHLHSHGYASNLSTQYTNICSAQSFSSSTEGTDVLVKGCDMTYGSSGGGWLRNYMPNSHSGNSVFGVVSGPHMGGFGNTYVGPRFSSSNFVPLCNVLNC